MSYENMDQLRKRLGMHDAGMILDVAAGRGEFLRFILRSFQTWNGAAGLDIDPATLATAKTNLGDLPVTLVTGSALSMPFPDNVFDTVTLSNSLHHIEDFETLFAELKRVCKTNGVVIINEMISDQATTLQENHMLYHHIISEIDRQMGQYHRDMYSRNELLAIIKKSGFKILEQFVHEATAAPHASKEDVDHLVASLKRKLDMLQNTEHYYFYENKIREVIERLNRDGFHKPKQHAFFLRPRNQDKGPALA